MTDPALEAPSRHDEAKVKFLERIQRGEPYNGGWSFCENASNVDPAQTDSKAMIGLRKNGNRRGQAFRET